MTRDIQHRWTRASTNDNGWHKVRRGITLPSPPLPSICRVPRSRALSIARRVNALQGINASDITSHVIFRGLSCMCTRALCARMRYIRNDVSSFISLSRSSRCEFSLTDSVSRLRVRFSRLNSQAECARKHGTEYNRSLIAVTRRPSP